MTTSAPPGYHAPGDFAAEVARLADRSPTARHHVIGTSVRGRDLVAVTIGPDATGGAAAGAPAVPVKPQVVVLAGIHGVEVISTELALRLLDDATAAEPAPAVAAVLARADLTIVPSLNVDGRTASLESLRGRKPLNTAPRRNANGVDLNRNWPWPAGVSDHWLPLSGTKAGWTPWSRGPHPLSEPETKAFAELGEQLRPLALLNLHSAGQILTHPWSSKAEPPEDADGFRAMAEAFIGAQRHHRYRWKQGRAWYPIVGSSNDHFYETYRTMAMTVETSLPMRTPREDRRTARFVFWWANPVDVAHHVDDDAPGCWAALAAALDHRDVPVGPGTTGG